MKSKFIKTAGLIIMLFCFLILSCAVVHADELDGYTVVDWSWNRDIETTDNNSVLMGQDVLFWRYVNTDNPIRNAIWKSAYGDELTDDEVTQIWIGSLEDKYLRVTMDADSIPDETVRAYIYAHVDEYVPDLKLKFDVDADLEGDNARKAKELFNGDVGYRVFRDSDGICKLELKFVPKFHLMPIENIYDESQKLPNMPNKILPRAQYPFSSVLFSMWGASAGSNEHYGALEVIEGDDPRYIYGQSFGYGDILEKGKLPENMIYPNFEAGRENEEGITAGQIEADTLDSNLVCIGQQYKKKGDLWYYSYGGAVGYIFKFPVRVTFEVDTRATLTRKFIDTETGEVIFTDAEAMLFGDAECITKIYTLAERSGKAIIDDSIEDEYIFERYAVKNGENGEIISEGISSYAQVKFCPKYPSKTLEIYIGKNKPIETPSSEDDNDGNDYTNIPPNEIDTTPIDPPMCDTHSNTITWQEKESHTVYDSEGYSHTCTHTYSYSATLKVESINITPDTLKSGYGFGVDISTSVSYKQTGQNRSSSYCSRTLSSNRTPTNKPAPPTKVTARLGWTTHTFEGIFIQGSSVPLEKVSSSSTKAAFSAPYNDVVGEKGIYTDIYLSGTGDAPRRHKIAFDIYGGGVNGTEWCTTAEKLFTINGDMYEDDITTST